MTSARKIRELVDALVVTGGSSSETRDRLDVRGQIDHAQIAGWIEVLAGLPIVGVASMVVIDALDEIVDLASGTADLAGQDLRIQLLKDATATTAFCLTENGVSAVFADFDMSPKLRQVWVACDFAPFWTESCRVDPWIDDASVVPAAGEEVRVPDPRRLVKDFVGNRVPKSVFPHLLSSDLPATSLVFEKWKNFAVVRLLHSLVNEVVSSDSDQVVITGTRPRKIDNDLKAPFSDELFKVASAAARWVYASGRDVDTRFALFTYELSREWPDGLTFKQGFEVRGQLALEAAETAFRAHVQETSKDTLKSLADLRKVLSEEVAKVVSQTRDLLNMMWRDFMVAATALLGRVVLLGADKPLNNPGPLKALLTGTAVFLMFSLFISLRANRKFMNIAATSRQAWRSKLYGFMNDDDFRTLSSEPLDHSNQVYNRVVKWVALAYLVVIVFMLWSAWGSKHQASEIETVAPTTAASGFQAPPSSPTTEGTLTGAKETGASGAPAPAASSLPPAIESALNGAKGSDASGAPMPAASSLPPALASGQMQSANVGDPLPTPRVAPAKAERHSP